MKLKKTQSPKVEPIIPDALEPYIKSTRLDGDHYIAETTDIPLDVIAELVSEYPELRKELIVSNWQLEIVLDAKGLLDDVEAIVSQADRATQIAWSKAPRIERTSKAIEGIRQALNLTHEQVDELFIEAAKVDV